jgi:hypothetical protein
MFSRGKNRVGAAVALMVVLAMVVATPAGAAGGRSWGEERGWMGGLVQQVLAWLGMPPSQGAGALSKCDQGSSIDPNGCPKDLSVHGSSIDPNGATSSTTDHGSQIDPNG